MTVRLTRVASALGVLAAVAWLLAPSPGLLVSIARNPQRSVDVLGADVVVLTICQLLVVGICCWAALAIALCVASAHHPHSRAERLSQRLTPGGLRRPLALAMGIGTLAIAGCGQSHQPAGVPPSTTPAYVASSEAFDWPREADSAPSSTAQPQADEPEAPATTTPPEPAEPSVDAHYGVLPGDSLWSIARAHLGAAASTAEVAYLVDEIYQANAALVGPDPDLLHPGTTLTIPTHPS